MHYILDCLYDCAGAQISINSTVPISFIYLSQQPVKYFFSSPEVAYPQRLHKIKIMRIQEIENLATLLQYTFANLWNDVECFFSQVPEFLDPVLAKGKPKTLVFYSSTYVNAYRFLVDWIRATCFIIESCNLCSILNLALIIQICKKLGSMIKLTKGDTQ